MIVLMTIFLSTSALACPALQGLHTNCLQTDGTVTKVRIVQTENNGVARYKIDWNGLRSNVFDADGVTRQTDIFDTGLSFRKTSTCEDDLLRHHVLMMNASGQVQMDITQEYTLVNRKLHFRAIDESGVYNEIRCR